MSLKGKSVLITGANGFIGKNLIKRLAKEEAEIYCIDKNQSELKELIKKEYIIDIKNFEELKKVISEINPNIIFHLAAFINHSRDINLIKETYEINVQGTINMLMATKDIKYDLFIYPNTSELYGDENETPFKENMKTKSMSPYSASKISAENYCNLFLEVFNKPIAIFRMPVVYGPYQKGNMFIPSLINSIIKNKEFSMTKGEQHRDFIYVDDIMGAFIISCKKIIKGTFNLGSGKEIKLKEIAEYLQKSNNLTVKFDKPYRENEMWHYYLDISKIKKELNWEPRYNIEEGLRKTIEWWKENE